MSNELRVSFTGYVCLSYHAHATICPLCVNYAKSGVTRGCSFAFRLTAWSVHGVRVLCHPNGNGNCYRSSLIGKDKAMLNPEYHLRQNPAYLGECGRQISGVDGGSISEVIGIRNRHI